MAECPSCGRPTNAKWRYCAWCAAPQRLKVVEFFPAHPRIESDVAKALRVSRYLGAEDDERHVRFSIWNEDGQRARAESAVSLAEEEAERLAGFLMNGAPQPRADIANPA
jgi:hypothetical protein